MDKAKRSRLLHQSSSKLVKTDVVKMLKDDSAWLGLDMEARARLVALLPKIQPDEGQYDELTHPLQGPLREYVDKAIKQWQQDLAAGRETKKFREYEITTTAADMPLESEDEAVDAKDGESDYEDTARKRKKK